MQQIYHQAKNNYLSWPLKYCCW